MEVLVDIDEDTPEKITITAPSLFQGQIKTLPGAAYGRKSKRWSIPLSWVGCLALRTTFREKLIVGPALLEWSQEYYADRVYPALVMRDQVESEGYPELFPHQRADVQFLSIARRAILANDLGTGKTRSAISSIRRLHELGEDVFPVLVACPNSTKISWQREFEEVWPGIVVRVIHGTATQRRKQFQDPAHVYIINWEGVSGHSRLAPYGSVALTRCVDCGGVDPKIKPTRCHAHEKELNQITFKSAIGDEAHRIKNPSTQTARGWKAATTHSNIRFALTGTPIANTPDDLWSILNWLYPEGYPSKTKYMDRMLDTIQNVFGAITVIGVKKNMEQEFFAGIDPILRRMPKSVVLQSLPPKVYQSRFVGMSPKQKKAYEQMKNLSIAELSGEMAIATTPLVQFTRLLQFAAAYGTVDSKDVWDKENEEMVKKEFVTLTDPSAKLDAFMDDIDSFGDQSVVVFSPSKQIINLLAARLDKEGITYGRITGDEDHVERQAHMDFFQEGKAQFILCTTGAGGTGITLTKGSICVFLGRPWSLVESEQSEGRVHRIGSDQHDSITYIDYVTQDTVEELVFEALVRKREHLDFILRDSKLLAKVIEANSLDEAKNKEEAEVDS